jgi:selenocysteine-specific elongation factor
MYDLHRKRKKMAKLSGDLKPEQVLNVNVGVLGHVDSGKTSLVKALSTLLSTASLDKNPQSIQRGITLDLGFSAFLLPLPERFSSSAIAEEHKFRALQFTLVDCPGKPL